MAKEFFRSIYVVTYREILRFIRERSRLISAFLMPIMFLVVFGAGFNRLIGEISPGVDFIQFMFPGILAMTVVMGSLFSALSIVWDREFGFLKELLIAPLSRTGIILGKALGGALTSSIRGLILLGFAPVIGINYSSPDSKINSYDSIAFNYTVRSRLCYRRKNAVTTRIPRNYEFCIFPNNFSVWCFLPLNLNTKHNPDTF